MLPKFRTSPTSIYYGVDNIFIYVCIINFVTKANIIPIILKCVDCFSSRTLEQLGLPPLAFAKSSDPPQFLIPLHGDMIYFQPPENLLPNAF
jgi:hypothetical protein